MKDSIVSKYPKIPSIFKRDSETNQLIMGDYSTPELQYLKNNPFVWTEKLDGMNTRVCFEKGNVLVGGRTERTQMPPLLLEKLNKLFPGIPSCTLRDIIGIGDDTTLPLVTLYGEGIGEKIQKSGALYNPDDVDFVLFDIKVGERWLGHGQVEDAGYALGVEVVRTVKVSSLLDALQSVRSGELRSTFGEFRPEGLVGKPLIPMCNRYGHRIIVKIKSVDFRHNMRILH